MSREIALMEPDAVVSALESRNPEAIMFDGFNPALIGLVVRCGTEPLALYDRARMLDILVSDHGMTSEEALDYFCYNVEGCWAGPCTPFIASFNDDPIGVRYPVDDLEIVADIGSDSEVFLGRHVGGGDMVDESADGGAGLVDGAAPENISVVLSDDGEVGA